jgi:hypothetical protein
LPDWIKVVAADSKDGIANFEGIPCQSLIDALRFCRGRLMRNRLLDAVQKAVQEGFIDEAAATSLSEELGL